MSAVMTQFMVALGIVGIQNVIGRLLPHAFWGAVIPVSYIGCLVYGFVSGLFKEGSELTMFMAGTGGIVILTLAWAEGRRAMKAKRKKELERMELLDL